MRAKCISNVTNELPESLRSNRTGYRDSETLPLKIGKVYPLYAVTKYQGFFWYFVKDEAIDRYPVWYPSALFEVFDRQIPEDWAFNEAFTEGRSAHPLLGIKEWIVSPLFYDRLTDGEIEESEVFGRYKAKYEDIL